MKQTLILKNAKISYTLKRYRRSKHVRLSISREKTLLVTAPKMTPFYCIEKILREKEEWILKTLKYFEGVTKLASEDLYKKHKKEARILVYNRLEYWNGLYNFSWGRISIRDQKTRWGSCSQKGNLNFSYKLAIIPEKLSDYVIVHELCHLKEFNHSKDFWELVARAIPDHKETRRELKEYLLH